MKKLLPILCFFGFLLFFVFTTQTFAQTAFPTFGPRLSPTTLPAPTGIPTAVPTNAPNVSPTPGQDTWVSDPDVTFVGKAGARAGEFLDWTLQNYQWAFNPTDAACKAHQSTSDTSGKWNTCRPLEAFWLSIAKIVYLFLLLFILASAFILIITRGRNLTLRRFFVRFVFILILITFSYAILSTLYAIADVIQGIFLSNPDPNTNKAHPIISEINLLNIGFNYKDFTGFRLQDTQYDESVFVALLLVKLTAITYYVMTGILLIRKIILWFFIVISPIFPLLLFYSPIRNTAKIWVGEFFRWLLYAPLFAVLLAGLVQVWSNFIPLQFNFVDHVVSSQDQTSPHTVCDANVPTTQKGYQDCYTTAVNILLGGPGQVLDINNSLNYQDTFAQYVVALLMLWVVIILPFLLLQIFLDYLNSFNFAESSVVKQLVASGSSYFKPPGVPAPAPSGPPPSGSTGRARALPFANKFAMQLPAATRISDTHTVTNTTEILKDVNISVPTLRDIARFETSMLSRDTARQTDVSHSQNTLTKLANPNQITNQSERTKFTEMKSKLTQAKMQGDPLATSILTAAQAAATTPASAATPKAQTVSSPVSQELAKIRQQGNVDQAQQVHNNFPGVNRVQQVSIEDYEAVKKMWKDTYEKLDAPKTTDGKDMDRKEWIQGDIEKVSLVTNLLMSNDTQKMKEGMDMVSKILPFLLIGGFSQSEVLAYLKAKQEAAKEVLEDLDKKSEDEETMVDRTQHKQEAKAQEMHQELEDPLKESDKQESPQAPEEKKEG